MNYEKKHSVRFSEFERSIDEGNLDRVEKLVRKMKITESPQEFQRKLNFVCYETIKKGNIQAVRMLEYLGAQVEKVPEEYVKYLDENLFYTMLLYLKCKGVRYKRVVQTENPA